MAEKLDSVYELITHLEQCMSIAKENNFGVTQKDIKQALGTLAENELYSRVAAQPDDTPEISNKREVLVRNVIKYATDGYMYKCIAWAIEKSNHELANKYAARDELVVPEKYIVFGTDGQPNAGWKKFLTENPKLCKLELKEKMKSHQYEETIKELTAKNTELHTQLQECLQALSTVKTLLQ